MQNIFVIIISLTLVISPIKLYAQNFLSGYIERADARTDIYNVILSGAKTNTSDRKTFFLTKDFQVIEATGLPYQTFVNYKGEVIDSPKGSDGIPDLVDGKGQIYLNQGNHFALSPTHSSPLANLPGSFTTVGVSMGVPGANALVSFKLGDWIQSSPQISKYVNSEGWLWYGSTPINIDVRPGPSSSQTCRFNNDLRDDVLANNLEMMVSPSSGGIMQVTSSTAYTSSGLLFAHSAVTFPGYDILDQTGTAYSLCQDVSGDSLDDLVALFGENNGTISIHSYINDGTGGFDSSYKLSQNFPDIKTKELKTHRKFTLAGARASGLFLALKPSNDSRILKILYPLVTQNQLEWTELYSVQYNGFQNSYPEFRVADIDGDGDSDIAITQATDADLTFVLWNELNQRGELRLDNRQIPLTQVSHVYNYNPRALSGAKVTIGGRQAMTSPQGVFKIFDIPSGTYTPEITHPLFAAAPLQSIAITTPVNNVKITAIKAVATPTPSTAPTKTSGNGSSSRIGQVTTAFKATKTTATLTIKYEGNQPEGSKCSYAVKAKVPQKPATKLVTIAKPIFSKKTIKLNARSVGLPKLGKKQKLTLNVSLSCKAGSALQSQNITQKNNVSIAKTTAGTTPQKWLEKISRKFKEQ